MNGTNSSVIVQQSKLREARSSVVLLSWSPRTATASPPSNLPLSTTQGSLSHAPARWLHHGWSRAGVPWPWTTAEPAWGQRTSPCEAARLADADPTATVWMMVWDVLQALSASCKQRNDRALRHHTTARTC